MASNPPPPLTQRFTGKAVGDSSLIGLAIPGNLIRGIVVDNYSASWLYIPQIIKYVPPYTVGYAIAVYPAQNTIDVTYQPGPLGLLSLNQGQPAIVLLSSDSVADSPGTTITTTPTSLQPLGVLSIPGGGDTAKSFLLTPQQSTLVAYVVGNERDCGLTVIGETSGIAYANDFAFGDTANPTIVQLAPQTDPVTNIDVNNPGLTPAIAYLFTYTGTVISAAQIVNAVSAHIQAFNPSTQGYDDITSFLVGSGHGIGVALYALNPASGFAEQIQQDGENNLSVSTAAKNAKQYALTKTGIANPGGSFAMGTVPAGTPIRGAMVAGNIVGTSVGGASVSVTVFVNDGTHTVWLAFVLIDEGGAANQVRRFEPSFIPSDLATTGIWTFFLNIGTITRLGAALTDAFGSVEF